MFWYQAVWHLALYFMAQALSGASSAKLVDYLAASQTVQFHSIRFASVLLPCRALIRNGIRCSRSCVCSLSRRQRPRSRVTAIKRIRQHLHSRLSIRPWGHRRNLIRSTLQLSYRRRQGRTWCPSDEILHSYAAPPASRTWWPSFIAPPRNVLTLPPLYYVFSGRSHKENKYLFILWRKMIKEFLET